MCVIFTTNYSFSWRRRPVDSETLLMTDFVNLNIKPAQSFKCAHRGRVCIREFIKVSVYTYMSIYIYKNTQKYIQCIILLYLHAPVSWFGGQLLWTGKI
jgi:hypothetical protein